MNEFEKSRDRIVKWVERQDNWTEEDWQHYRAVIKALDKQIPKKVKIKKYAPTRCNCGFEFSIHYGDGYYSIPFELKTPYCRNCGQALDWSDKE